MNVSDLRPAREFAQKHGVKAVAFGPPGSGKTPLFNTAPRPVLCAIEPGLLSMRSSDVPTWTAETPERIDEFFKWLFNSAETKNFDTVGIDSGSEMAVTYLQRELQGKSSAGNKRHGQEAYGAMAEKVLQHLTPLYYLRQKHVYIICHEGQREGDSKLVPIFPGQALNSAVPHKYDEVLHIGIHNIPGYGQHRSIQTNATIDIMARDRSGMLSQYEELDLAKLFTKCMS